MEILGNLRKSKSSMAKNNKLYTCEFCAFNTSYKTRYDEHLLTLKHFKLADRKSIGNQKHQKHQNSKELEKYKPFTCKYCNRFYITSSGLWKHNKKCEQQNMIHMIVNELNEVKKQNAELKELFTQNQIIASTNIKPSSSITNITGDHSNIQNNTFNIQFLQNECKNAINMNDFVNAFEVGVRQLDCIKDNGVVKAISTMFIETLNKYSLHERPIHCTDTKRLTMFIKDNDVWHTKEEGKQKFTKAIEEVQKIAMKSIPQWEDHYKSKIKNDDTFTDKYMTLVKKTTNILTDDDSKKIMKVIAPNVKLGKDNEITES